MKLIEVLAVADENKTLVVLGLDGATLAIYDGKNGIDEKFNGASVESITTENNALIITIDW